jgi:hypothetical protein
MPSVKKYVVIGVVFVVIGSLLYSAPMLLRTVQNTPNPSGNSQNNFHTTSQVILDKISVFEDEACSKSLQTIDWGIVESNASYSRVFYARNDNIGNILNNIDVVWQHLNISPSSVYISISINYGEAPIAPKEVRQINITLNVLGLLESSNELNQSADIPQFTFDLELAGRLLNATYVYVHCDALRDANNITVTYEDDLNETVSVVIEFDVWQPAGPRMVWNTTEYSSSFSVSWPYAFGSYEVILTINHERYGVFNYSKYLIGT